MIGSLSRIYRLAVEDLTIDRKLLAIVITPIALFLPLAILLYFLFTQAQCEATAELHHNRVLNLCARIQYTVMESGMPVIAYATTHDRTQLSHYEAAREQTRRLIANLLEESKANEGELLRARNVEKSLIQLFQLSNYAIRIADFGGQQTAPLEAKRVMGEMKSLISTAIDRMQTFSDLDFKRSGYEGSHYRDACLALIISCGALSVLASVAASRFLSRGLTKRISKIIESTEAIAAGSKSWESVSGHDEIAKVDHFLKEMVTSLDAAHRREQAALSEREEHLRTIMQSMPVGILLAGSSGTIEMSNQALDTLTGSSSVGKQVSLLLPGSTPLIDSADSSKNRFRLGQDQNGPLLEVSVSRVNLGGNPKALFVLEDISQRAALEQMKTEFVAMVSHDLRSPLASLHCIFDSLETGVYGKLEPAGEAAVVRADAEVDRLLRLVTNLLDCEKMETGKLELDREQGKLDETVARALNAVRMVAEGKRIEIRLQLKDNLDAYFDHDKIIQVLVNLLSNAIKFSPSHSVVSITSTSSKSCVRISVIDSGPGVPMESRTVIFQRFKQVSNDDHRVRGGFGLGLAICKMIIDAHDGQIGIDDHPDGGSVFWFELPTQSSTLETHAFGEGIAADR